MTIQLERARTLTTARPDQFRIRGLPQVEEAKSQPQQLSELTGADIANIAKYKEAMQLLDSNAMANLTFDQKLSLFIYYVWREKPLERVRESDIPRELEKRAIADVHDNLEERYLRFEGVMEMTRQVQNKGFRDPKITEFDYWVYQDWLYRATNAKELSKDIPTIFLTEEVPRTVKISMISRSVEKLKHYGVIDQSVPSRRRALKLARLARAKKTNKDISVENLAGMLDVAVGTLRKDLAYLRSRGEIQGDKRTAEQRDDLVKKIMNVISSLQMNGRDYEAGDIGPAEIARKLGMDRKYITHFMIVNRSRFNNLPKRKDTHRSRRSVKEYYKRKLREILESNPTIPPGEIYKLISENDPTMPYSIETVYDILRELIEESGALGKREVWERNRNLVLSVIREHGDLSASQILTLVSGEGINVSLALVKKLKRKNK